jgi:hypothetical protein
MSDRADELVEQLLEKTERKKLEWLPQEFREFDAFHADIGEGFEFYIERTANGNDDKVISLELRKGGNVVFAESADNIIGRSRALALLGTSPDAKISKFRLFSDLFHAARNSAMGADQTIEKVQQLLERLG